MVEIECPACGAPGRVTKEKTLTRLVCRKCLKVFHVTASGRSVPGEPPNTSQTATSASAAKAAADPTKNSSSGSSVLRRGVSCRRVGTIGIVLGVLMLGAVTFFLYGYLRPDSLENRVTQAARAAVLGDRRTVQELAAAGSGDSIDDWYLAIRPKCDELLQHLGS